METIHDIVAAKPLDGYKVDVEFDTGERGVLDCTRYLDKPYWINFRDPCLPRLLPSLAKPWQCVHFVIYFYKIWKNKMF